VSRDPFSGHSPSLAEVWPGIDARLRALLAARGEFGHAEDIIQEVAARALESAAYLALSQGHPTRALELAAAATHLRQSVNATQHVAEQSKLDQTLLPAWKALSGTEGKLAWTRGSTMSLENAIQLALAPLDKALTA